MAALLPALPLVPLPVWLPRLAPPALVELPAVLGAVGALVAPPPSGCRDGGSGGEPAGGAAGPPRHRPDGPGAVTLLAATGTPAWSGIPPGGRCATLTGITPPSTTPCTLSSNSRRAWHRRSAATSHPRGHVAVTSSASRCAPTSPRTIAPRLPPILLVPSAPVFLSASSSERSPVTRAPPPPVLASRAAAQSPLGEPNTRPARPRRSTIAEPPLGILEPSAS
ncbi:hypothetical protein KM043_006315 [Ampulex compressa]|nr:hypothetical protein KM043_006315 [Ampulex compressa]